MVKLLFIKKYIYYYNVLLLFKSFLSSFSFLFVLSWLVYSVLELIQTARARTNQSPRFRYMQRGYYKITRYRYSKIYNVNYFNVSHYECELQFSKFILLSIHYLQFIHKKNYEKPVAVSVAILTSRFP